MEKASLLQRSCIFIAVCFSSRQVKSALEISPKTNHEYFSKFSASPESARHWSLADPGCDFHVLRGTTAYFSDRTHRCLLCLRGRALLTPEQTATLQSLWESRRQEILRIRGSSKKMSLEQQQQINAEEKRFDQKRNDVLTTSQCDIILLINDISKSVVKTCSSDFKARADAAFTKEEKAAITAELSKAIKDAFQAEMKASLPAERFAAYQAALGKH